MTRLFAKDLKTPRPVSAPEIGWTSAALAGAADIEVTKHELRVTLAPLSSAHRTRAIAALCEQLNQSKIVFPGSTLRLRYAIRENP